MHGRDSLTFDQEAHYDLYYIQHRNLLLDVYILLMTVKVILIRNNR
ncbi:sugar transferase [bacterium]|nr:sugar transferase [bacterium]